MERDLKEALRDAWKLIDYIRERLDDPLSSERDKARWASILISALKIVERLHEKAGAEEGQDLASLLSDIEKSPEFKESKKFIKAIEELEKLSCVAEK